ncbi:hypothetical protein [Roseovarius sp. D22-M7]|uniref:hypothetical protein n=1 Tax=Roseovarius sp. D22-M7 TaxID=3127116 RepID=UPI00301036BF
MPVLRLGHLGPVSFALREIDGHAEQAVDPQDPAHAALTLAQTITRLPQGAEFAALPVALVHRLCWTIYRHLYPGALENRAQCSGCGEAFEFALDLAAIVATQDAEAADVDAPRDGWWTLPSGGRLRAPTLGDLDGATGEPEALLAALAEGGVTQQEADAFLERAAPLLDFELETTCPHCEAVHLLRFSMPHYLGRKLADERPFLLREVHLLAGQYGWAHAEILALTRSDRRAFAALIQSERLQTQSRRLQAVS